MTNLPVFKMSYIRRASPMGLSVIGAPPRDDPAKVPTLVFLLSLYERLVELNGRNELTWV
jgi:hypothetical protein